jgi:hypothetical protein
VKLGVGKSTGRFLAALALAGIALSPLTAAPAAPRAVGIVYWGNANTGVAVRVINRIDGDKIAEAEVKKLGGDGWTLLEQSNAPGFGAAMCTRQSGKVRFYTAHGFATGKDAVDAAKAKASAAGGVAWLCSRALWKVPQPGSAQSGGMIDAAKGAVGKAVTCKETEPSLVDLPTGTATPVEAKPNCPEKDSASKDGFALPCTCVRG